MTVDRAAFATWIARYERGWGTEGAAPVRELFAANATYRHSPAAEPVVGIDAIVADWEQERDGADETFTMAAQILAVDGNIGVARVSVRVLHGLVGTTMNVGQFTTVDAAADTTWFINFMDAANALPEYGEIRRLLIENLGPLAGRRVLDVGCGTGDDTRELARLGATVVGTDLSEAMLAEARRRTAGVDFRLEDLQQLSFPDNSFDAVRVKLVRQHCPDIDAADEELMRVTRPGSRIAIFDFDFETLALDHPDRDATREIVHRWVDNHRQGWSGRQLRRRFTRLREVTISPCTVQFPFEFFRDTMAGMDVPATWWQPLEEAAAAKCRERRFRDVQRRESVVHST